MVRVTAVLAATLEGIVNSQFVRLPYTEAVDILEKSGQTFEFPVSAVNKISNYD